MSRALQAEPGILAESEPLRRRSVWTMIREQPAAAVGAVVLLLIILMALLAPVLAPYGLHQQVGPTFGHPSAKHWLGLDDGGVDMVTLLMWGARISLVVGWLPVSPLAQPPMIVENKPAPPPACTMTIPSGRNFGNCESLAQSGKVLPLTARNSDVLPNGIAVSTAAPASAAAGRMRFSAARLSIE